MNDIYFIMCYNNSIRYLDVSISIENNKSKNVYNLIKTKG